MEKSETLDVVTPNDVKITQDAVREESREILVPPNDVANAKQNGVEETLVESRDIQRTELNNPTGLESHVTPNDAIVNQPIGFEGVVANNGVIDSQPVGAESMLVDSQVTPDGVIVKQPAGMEGMLVENFKNPREEKRKHKNKYKNASNNIEMTQIGAAAVGNRMHRSSIGSIFDDYDGDGGVNRRSDGCTLCFSCNCCEDITCCDLSEVLDCDGCNGCDCDCDCDGVDCDGVDCGDCEVGDGGSWGGNDSD